MRGYIRKLLTMICLLFGTSVEAETDSQSEPDSTILLVRLYLDGRVTLDSQVVQIGELQKPFTEASTKGGAVWIYSENLNLGNMPNAKEVLTEVAKANLPVFFPYSHKQDRLGNNQLRKGEEEPTANQDDVLSIVRPTAYIYGLILS